ncbi:MAG: hypothetical protein LWY06_17980 [Firmicutes bacterium]|nr:hypothetical protein [Bacillota bacterium]
MINRIPSLDVSGLQPAPQIKGSASPVIKEEADPKDAVILTGSKPRAGLKASIDSLPEIIAGRIEEKEAKSSVLNTETTSVKHEKPPAVLTQMEESPSISELLGSDPITVLSAKPKVEGGIDVGPFEKKLQEELGSLSRIQNPWDINGLQGKVASIQELNDTFAEITADKSIPYEFLPDGCYARAHTAAQKYLDKGINCAKLYVMLDNIDWNNPSGFPDERFRAENKFTKGEWWYHVAPVVFAKDESGNTEGYVIDPAVNKDRPIKASEWIKAFWTEDFKVVFDTTHADIYEPQLEDFTNNQPREFSQKEFDKWMPEALKTNKEYGAELKQIKDSYYAHHPEEKPDRA